MKGSKQASNRGRVLANRATKALVSGDVDQARTLARRALETTPRDPQVLYSVAEIAWQLHDATTTATLIDEAITSGLAPG